MKLKNENGDKGQSVSSSAGSMITQSDVQTLLAPVTQAEESLLSSVRTSVVDYFQFFYPFTDATEARCLILNATSLICCLVKGSFRYYVMAELSPFRLIYRERVTQLK